MVTYDSECCDHGEYEEYNSEPYDDSKPRWMFSLRNREPLNSGGKSKPAWTSAIKANSPSLRTYSEGGSLRTNRMRLLMKMLIKIFTFISIIQAEKQVYPQNVSTHLKELESILKL